MICERSIAPIAGALTLVAMASHSSFASSVVAAAQSFAAGREWAVAVFLCLSTTALVFALARTLVDRRSAAAAAAASSHKAAVASRARDAEFARFQRSYLCVYVVIMLADWMQGTHMYTLYTSYADEAGSNVQVGTLFFTGSLAAGLLGTFTGPLVDRFGRKRACLVYVALEVRVRRLEHVPPTGRLLALTLTPPPDPHPHPGVHQPARARAVDGLAPPRPRPRRHLDLTPLLRL